MNAATLPHFSQREHQFDAARLGIWVFIASEILFFAPLFTSYAFLRYLSADGIGEASRHTNFIAGTINTAVLLSSSLFVALATRSTRLLDSRTTAWLLRVAALLGICFLAIKGYEYYDDWQSHLVPSISFQFDGAHAHVAELFFLLYFAMTGLHAIHLTIGVCAVLWFASRAKHDLKKSQHGIEVTALYWHFVDAIWVFLYPMFYLVQRHG